MKKKQGFTLIELLVYIVLVGIIVIIAGRAFVDATGFRLRTSRYLETIMQGSDLITYMQEDIRRTGAKYWINPVASSSSGASSASNAAGTYAMDSVYWKIDDGDSSSFLASTDSLEFRTGIYNESGTLTGWEQVRWALQGTELWRRVVKRVSLSGSSSPSSSALVENVRMATGVTSLRFRYGMYALDSTLINVKLFPVGTPSASLPSSSSAYALVDYHSPTSGPVISSATDGSTQISGLGAGTDTYFKLVDAGGHLLAIPLHKNRTYRLHFGLGSNDSAATYFRQAKDYIGVALHTSANLNNLVPGTNNYPFYSALDTSIHDRSLDFTPSADEQAAILFRFKLRNPFGSATTDMAKAAFRMDSVRVVEISKDTLIWKDSFNSTEIPLKKRVKAIEVFIGLQKRGAESSIRRLIPVPNNGV